MVLVLETPFHHPPGRLAVPIPGERFTRRPSQEVESVVASLAQIHQVSHGTVGFVPIDVMDGAHKGLPVLTEVIRSQVGSLLEFHPAILTTVIRPLPHLGLDQFPLP
jgi:hypothetical protein